MVVHRLWKACVFWHIDNWQLTSNSHHLLLMLREQDAPLPLRCAAFFSKNERTAGVSIYSVNQLSPRPFSRDHFFATKITGEHGFTLQQVDGGFHRVSFLLSPYCRDLVWRCLMSQEKTTDPLFSAAKQTVVQEVKKPEDAVMWPLLRQRHVGADWGVVKRDFYFEFKFDLYYIDILFHRIVLVD